MPDFDETARCLDWRRLGKGRVEAKQIHLAISDPSYGWQNHPIVNAWRGSADALCLYGITMCKEWIRRGYIDNQLPWFQERLTTSTPNMPKWLGREDFHRSHKSNLLRKDPAHYGPLWPDVPPNLEYVWPVRA